MQEASENGATNIFRSPVGVNVVHNAMIVGTTLEVVVGRKYLLGMMQAQATKAAEVVAQATEAVAQAIKAVAQVTKVVEAVARATKVVAQATKAVA